MLVISEEAKDHFEEVRVWAVKNGLAGRFDEGLCRLHLYGCDWLDQERCRVTLYKDFAPQSFQFSIEFRQADGSYRQSLNGGFIFHGPHDGFGSGSAPSFAVSLDKSVGWQMHT